MQRILTVHSYQAYSSPFGPEIIVHKVQTASKKEGYTWDYMLKKKNRQFKKQKGEQNLYYLLTRVCYSYSLEFYIILIFDIHPARINAYNHSLYT